MSERISRIEKPVWIALIIASAVAATTFNSIAFGLNALRVYDSSVHTFFIASLVMGAIIAIDHWLHQKSLWFRLLLVIIVIVPTTYAGIWLAAIWLYFVNPFANYTNFIPSTRTLLFSLAISYIFGLGGYLLITARLNLIVAKRAVREKEEAEKRARELARQARLASLESRVQPHFLFNTLNSIAALIRENPESAERTVERLSNVLRFSLSPENESTTTVRNEIKLVSDYLEIQKVRFEDRLEYEFKIDDDVLEAQIPAFSIHVLVENSLKHSTGSQTRVEVNISTTDEHVEITVSDNGAGFLESDLRAGHGLDVLKERVATLYGKDGEVDFSKSSSGVVSVVVPKKW